MCIWTQLWCHTCVCSLFQVTKHISTGLYIYDLTSTRPPTKCLTGNIFYPAVCIKPRQSDQKNQYPSTPSHGGTPHAPVELAETFLVESVPDVDEAVGAPRGECVEAAVECDCVDREDLLHTVLLDAVTLEGILLLLHLWAWVHVLDGNSGYKWSQLMLN